MSARRVPPPTAAPPLPPWLQTIADGLPPLLTVDEAAAVLRVKRETMRMWIRQGALQSVRNIPGQGSSRALVPATAIIQWLQDRAR